MAIAEDIDSPFEVTRTESAAVIGTVRSRDVGLETNFLQGPGESPERSGDGSGVTSAIAFSIGDETTDPGKELVLPMLLLRMFLILGVRSIPSLSGAGRENSSDARLVLCALAATMLKPGLMSVCMRRPALRGLDRSEFSGGNCRWVEVLSAANEVGLIEVLEVPGEGVGAIVLVLNRDNEGGG